MFFDTFFFIFVGRRGWKAHLRQGGNGVARKAKGRDG